MTHEEISLHHTIIPEGKVYDHYVEIHKNEYES
jgi:hypothetical protein